MLRRHCYCLRALSDQRLVRPYEQKLPKKPSKKQLEKELTLLWNLSHTGMKKAFTNPCSGCEYSVSRKTLWLTDREAQVTLLTFEKASAEFGLHVGRTWDKRYAQHDRFRQSMDGNRSLWLSWESSRFSYVHPQSVIALPLRMMLDDPHTRHSSQP